MSQSGRQRALQRLGQILTGIVDELRALAAHELLAAIQFGSTAGPVLKYETDVDLLLVFRTLPAPRSQRYELIRTAEEAGNRALASAFLSSGRRLQLSPLLFTLAEACHWHAFYLDLPDHSRDLFEQHQVASQLLASIAAWIAHSGSQRVDRGLRWYWRLGDDPSRSFRPRIAA